MVKVGCFKNTSRRPAGRPAGLSAGLPALLPVFLYVLLLSRPIICSEFYSVALQTEAYERCLQTYSLTTCFTSNGTTVACDSADSIDSFRMPDW